MVAPNFCKLANTFPVIHCYTKHTLVTDSKVNCDHYLMADFLGNDITYLVFWLEIPSCPLFTSMAISGVPFCLDFPISLSEHKNFVTAQYDAKDIWHEDDRNSSPHKVRWKMLASDWLRLTLFVSTVGIFRLTSITPMDW